MKTKSHASEFAHYIGIDWSGAKTPKRSHSIALAECNSGYCHSTGVKSSVMSSPTAVQNRLSREDVYNVLSKSIKSKRRTLVGIDCNFGYCQSVAQKQFQTNIKAQQLWTEINTLCKGDTNFFAGNVWTASTLSKDFWCDGKQPGWFDAKRLRRVTEQAAADQGLGIPESPFKLIGAKQVGKGGLAGMRFLHQLKREFGDNVAIWPFENHLMQTATLVITEIYPRLFIRFAGFGNQKVRTIKDLNSILATLDSAQYKQENQNSDLNDHLTDAIIASAGLRYFVESTNSKNPLDTDKLPDAAIELEGWIFGVNPP